MDALPTRRDAGAGTVPRPAAAAVVDTRWWYDASCDAVLAAWLEPRIAAQWLFATATRPLRAATIDARPGGALRFVTRDSVEIAGRLDALARSTGLRLTLELDGSSTTVTVDVRPVGHGTTLHVRHAGVPGDRAGWLEARWIGMLYGLGEALDCDSHELFPHLEPQ
jgi:uncharacterized protein YndB with AHSA1/START domain